MLLVGRDHQRPGRAQDDLVARLLEVPHRDGGLAPAGGEHRRLVDQVAEVGPREAWRGGGHPVQIDVGRQRHLAHVNAQDRGPVLAVRQIEGHVTIEPSRTQQGRVEHVGTVGGGQDDDGLVGLEAVHLGQDLIQRLLALVVPAAEAGPPGAPDRIRLVDEDDARSPGLGGPEQVAHPGGAHADEHLDELRTGDREERHLGFPGQRLGQHGLPPAGRPDEERVVPARRRDLQRALGVELPSHVPEVRLLDGVGVRHAVRRVRQHDAVAVEQGHRVAQGGPGQDAEAADGLGLGPVAGGDQQPRDAVAAAGEPHGQHPADRLDLAVERQLAAGQPHRGEGRQPARHVHLDADEHRLDAHQGRGEHVRQHPPILRQRLDAGQRHGSDTPDVLRASS
jgi:hypothetical protein